MTMIMHPQTAKEYNKVIQASLVGRYFQNRNGGHVRKLLEIHSDYVIVTDPWHNTKAIQTNVFWENYGLD